DKSTTTLDDCLTSRRIASAQFAIAGTSVPKDTMCPREIKRFASTRAWLRSASAYDKKTLLTIHLLCVPPAQPGTGRTRQWKCNLPHQSKQRRRSPFLSRQA